MLVDASSTGRLRVDKADSSWMVIMNKPHLVRYLFDVASAAMFVFCDILAC